jgi:uncharacterized protein (TIGR03437 family)
MKSPVVFLWTAFLGVAGGSQLYAQMTVVNAASFDAAQPIAPGSFVAAFGQNLCSETTTGSLISQGEFPETLGGCSVTVNGIAAMMQYVSPGQVNFIMPAGVASGQASVTIHNGSQAITGNALAGPTGPGIFALDGMGMGEGAMLNGDLWRTPPFSTATDGHATVVAMYVTGMDTSSAPTVMVSGMPANVAWAGNIPGYPGLQQINIMLAEGMAGAGRVPVMVTSDGQASNITFMHILPTTAMMQGMPGWRAGMMMGENMPRGHEMSDMVFNPSNKTALVTDENDDVVRVISLESGSTTATITLPSGSQAHSLAVNAAGTMAAIGLSAKASVAIIDLSQNSVIATIGTGYYPSGLAFSGSSLLVTNGASGTVAVIDTSTGTTTHTVTVGIGANGIAAEGNTAVVTNMLAGSVSIIDLTTYTVTSVAAPPGIRPCEVAISAQANKAVITTPMSNGFLILDLAAKALTEISTVDVNAFGPGAVAISGQNVYIANQMAASVTVADLGSGSVMKTFTVDPGPVALAVDASNNQLLVLAEGTGTLDVIDLSTYALRSRMDAGSTERQGRFTMPLISSTTPTSAAAGSMFPLTITGSGFQGVQGIAFYLTSSTGMMGGMGGGMGGVMGQADSSIAVSGIQVNSDGTQITASVQILSTATAGTRQIRLKTAYGEIMGMTSVSLFTVSK